MYLHTMTLQALGPFAGAHTIDFAELGASGIFLLEGPTGAGKSTLIDALVFALYGKVASKDASDERLRSAHASPADETVVDLVFECGSGIYRVRRTPAYQRPKQRGSGTTLQQASVRLWRLSSPDAPEDGELLSARLDEAGLELQRIVGLDRHQFVQTVVLPQGEFAGFLRAKPEDRRGLLQRVFGTAVYEQVEQRLVRMRAEVGRAVEDGREAVARSTAHLLGAAGLAEEEATALQAASGSLEDPDGEGGLLALGRAHADALEERARRARTVADQAKAACAGTQQALDDGRRQLDLVRRRTALRTELATLEARSDEHQREADRC
ncbi:AAA family ATPase, partial [Actinotalea sp. C106]|uniref:AAA family ATPase n=1 Tax=Actinotalea sp. C106 TaxID=2908644 RepID=UPI002029166D